MQEEMGATLADVERKRFPDGEMYVRILADTRGAEVAVIGNTRSDADFVELLLLLNAAREAGASHVTAVLPYFAFPHEKLSLVAACRTFRATECSMAHAVLQFIRHYLLIPRKCS